jgi:hypothetical protein
MFSCALFLVQQLTSMLVDDVAATLVDKKEMTGMLSLA